MIKLLTINIILILSVSECVNKRSKMAYDAGDYLCRYTVEKNILELSRNRNNPRFVFIGKGLTDKLNSIKNNLTHGYSISVFEGDYKPLAPEGNATNYIIISDKNRKLVGIRLKYDKDVRKFHILGFWTINN